VDRLRDPGAGSEMRAGDLRSRQLALPDWHPSAAGYERDGPEADHAADGGGQGRDTAAESDREDDSYGWEALGEPGADRPAPADIRLTAERQAHILDGDRTGGGHRHGLGRPGKTEFPAGWDAGKIVESLLSVARHPDEPPARQNWNDRWRVQGEREGVSIVVIVTSDGLIWTGWPREGSPGVVKNKPQDW
jgi:Bacterial EndoU nuclease